MEVANRNHVRQLLHHNPSQQYHVFVVNPLLEICPSYIPCCIEIHVAGRAVTITQSDDVRSTPHPTSGATYGASQKHA